MRPVVVCVLMVLALTACGAQTATTPDNAGTQVTAPAATDIFVPTLPAEVTIPPQERDVVTPAGGDTLPVPGTLAAAATEDPLAGQPYDLIIFEQSGGEATAPLTIEIRPDGTVIRNGVTLQIGADQLTGIYELLDAINVFGLGGVFTAPGASSGVISYALTVERGGGSRRIDAQQGFVPDELLALFTVISALGA